MRPYSRFAHSSHTHLKQIGHLWRRRLQVALLAGEQFMALLAASIALAA